MRQIIGKASNIVSYVYKSVNASKFLEDEKRLQAANSTRWYSQFYMLNSILSVSEDKLNLLECSHKLTTYERKLLQEPCTILQPFQEATLEIQKEQTVSASLAVPLTVALKNQMQCISSTYNCKMITTLKSSLQKRMSKYGEDEEFVIAAVLDAPTRTQVGICYSLCRSKSSTELMLSVSKRDVKQSFFIFIFIFTIQANMVSCLNP